MTPSVPDLRPSPVSRRAILTSAAAATIGAMCPIRSSAGAASGTAAPASAPEDARHDQIAALVAELDLPEPLIVETYRRAALQNVWAAVNPKVFFGYFSVCADGQGFGYGNTYPSLDGHQMSDALLWLGQIDVVKANWNYVRRFQRPNGHLPIAILPGMKEVGGTPVDPNGGVYKHWVPGDPLRALGGPTYIQNADAIYRHTFDRVWLVAQLPSVNLAAEFLASLTNSDGLVAGAGYYMERPTRIEYDGVTQTHAVDAFRRVAALNELVGDAAAVGRYRALADRIAACFTRTFWTNGHFAEFIHPQRGIIDHHGLSDVDWSALANDVAAPEQRATLWARLKDESRLHYGGMPTGIAERPETYEDWEFTHPDRMDLAAMGRVWYLECRARARMNDGEGIARTLRQVCEVGRKDGYFWRERYVADGKGGCLGRGATKYCEYPANLIRIVQRFVFGVDLRLDGAIALAPAVPGTYWDAGFGQTLVCRGQRLRYRMRRDGITGEFRGPSPQRLLARFPAGPTNTTGRATIDGESTGVTRDGEFLSLTLPPTPAGCRFAIHHG
ncbi:MAG: hypothetical protein HY718_13470 [Planctomycetes bacterium]|nr:hypothetical protein [Planctomycetota bacterium]